MRVPRPRVIPLLVLSSVSLLAQGQTDLPQFRAGVELVQLDVAVLDDKRQPVRGLTAADFTVLDNGVAAPIRAFTPVELAPRTRSTEAVWANEAPPDVVTNQVGQQDGRLVIILMDRSIPYQGPSVLAQKIAVAAVDALGPHDLAALISTSGVYTPQNFTADRGRLVKAIMQRDWSTESTGFLWSLDEGGDGRCLCGLCVLETVTRVSEAVRDAPRRRKILLFIGRGLVVGSPPRPASADPGCEHPLKLARQKLYDSLAVSNLTVHSIDPRGLENVGDHTKASVGGGIDRPVNSGPAMRLQQLTGARNDVLRTQESLRILPARTGGRTVVNTNAPDEQIPEIFRESEAYYLLGVEGGTSNRPEGTRSIEVKVARKGVRVFAQRRYVLPPARKGEAPVSPAAAVSAPVSPEEVLNGLLPSAGLPLALAVTPFTSPESARPVVRVNIDVKAFARDDGSAVPLDVAVLAVDGTGRTLASARQTSTISAVRRSDSSAEVNVQSHLELAPGEYEVRVAVSDPAAGKTASVFSGVTVPKFESAALSLSGVAVDTTSAPSAAPAPTTRRVFRRHERVRALLQIYQGTERTEAMAAVSMRVQILDAKGGAVRDQSLPFTENAFANRRADCVITLPLANLPPGEYLLKLEASADRHTAGRALRFAVK
jgi:VWFA-related protein